MRTPKHLDRLSYSRLVSLANQAFRRVERAMIKMAKGSPDALRYGWDFPTANVYFPELVKGYRIIMEEIRYRPEYIQKTESIRQSI